MLINSHLQSKFLSRCIIVAALTVTLLTVVSSAQAVSETPKIYAVHLSGVISPLSARRVVQTVRNAENDHATAILIQINSPGGTQSSVQDITRALLASTVPVVVYVGGDQKASALSGALFITLSASIAAMSPSATLSAGNPESLTDTALSRAEQDRLNQIIQYASNTASARHRNVQAVTNMINKNEQLTAQQAQADGIVDRIAPSIDALLAGINGLDVQTLAGPQKVQSENARIVWQKANWHELILQKITDPNVAYVLFSLGALLLVIELFNPGRLIAGIPGIIALVAAFVAFGNMPVSWVGVGLMAGAFILFIRELFTPKLTPVGPAGVLLFVIGSFTLYRPVSQSSSIVPAVGVSVWIILGTTLVIVVVLLLMMRAIFRVRNAVAPANASWLIGADGIVLQALQPRGVVRVRGQEWTAVTEGRSVAEGGHVRVESVSAGVLHVKPSDAGSDLVKSLDGSRLRTSGPASN